MPRRRDNSQPQPQQQSQTWIFSWVASLALSGRRTERGRIAKAPLIRSHWMGANLICRRPWMRDMLVNPETLCWQRISLPCFESRRSIVVGRLKCRSLRNGLEIRSRGSRTRARGSRTLESSDRGLKTSAMEVISGLFPQHEFSNKKKIQRLHIAGSSSSINFNLCQNYSASGDRENDSISTPFSSPIQ